MKLRIGIGLILCLLMHRQAIGQNVQYENLALKYVLAHKEKFNVSDSINLFIGRYTKQKMKEDIFLKNGFWHNKGIVKPNCYSSSDKSKNSKTENRYKISIPKTKKVVYKMDQIQPVQFLEFFTRFYYCRYVYVYFLLDAYNGMKLQYLIKFDSNGKIIDYCGSGIVI